VWVQFNHFKLKHLLNDTDMLTSQEHHLTLDDYFDAYEKLPIETGEFYFDAPSNLDSYDVPSCHFDELRADFVPVRPTAWTVDCCSTTTCPLDGISMAHLSSTHLAMDFLTGEGSLSNDPMAYTISGNATCSVIFDTGTSLAITFDPADFIMPIGKSTHTHLSGIANGLRIEGVLEDKQSPDCAKSRTGFVIFFSGVPILWVSKLQNQVALSTLEAEYIACVT